MTPKNPSIFHTPKNSITDSVYENARNISKAKKIIKSEVKIVSSKKRNFGQTIAQNKKINSEVYNKKEKIDETINLLENENENENESENENENESKNEILFPKKTKANTSNVVSIQKMIKNEAKNVNSKICDKDEWTCMICTFSHRTLHERTYLQCAICSSSRPALSLSVSY